MATQNNTAVSEKIRDGLKINQATDVVPTRVADSIVPVFEVAAEKKMKIAASVLSDASSATIMTTHATKKTFLCGVSLSVAKDAVSDSVYTYITLVPRGDGNKVIIRLMYEPITAASNLYIEKTFYCPIELKKNSAVSIAHQAATASIDGAVTLLYYEED